MRRIEFAWAGFALLCLAVLAVEWAPSGRAALALPAFRVTPPAVVAQPRRSPVSVSEIAVLARPIFAQSRRPPAPMQTSVAGAKPMPRLAGIVILSGYRRAIFEGADAQSLSVGETDSVAGWQVAQIDPDSVSLQTGPTRLRLKPSLLAGSRLPPPRRDPWVTPRATGILRARWSDPQYQP